MARDDCTSNQSEITNVTHPVNVCHPPDAISRPHISQAMPVAAMRSPFIAIAIGTEATTIVTRPAIDDCVAHASRTPSAPSDTSDRNPLQASATCSSVDGS